MGQDVIYILHANYETFKHNVRTLEEQLTCLPDVLVEINVNQIASLKSTAT